MVRSMWHRSLWSLVALCGVLLVASFHEHGVQTAPASAPRSSTTSAVAECADADLHADYRARDAGAGHRFGVVRLRNTSDYACVVRGWGGLSYVGGGDGTQVGAAADRDGDRARRVVLAPGERALSTVSETVASNYPRARCRPTHVDGFRVYVPDSTRSQFVAHPTTGCRNDSVHLLSHRPFRG
ncbi:hypothetical protein J2X46_004581 [Nocardioides sp. BE266]|uniref:DUF4232 domain-containing protein n=1 Tax=Nocardioides sp. BE266 TaxID=2817725 RepID=UPI00285841AB|nr:DUF4232 domain-containing protein [Nocardioides sp. BE266]MDR7255571.1 hypothetical protein [Nocardioides sp. BE266]